MVLRPVKNYCVCAEPLSRVQLCDPMDCSTPGSSVPGDSPSKTTGVGCHDSSRGSSQHRDRTQISCVAGRFFTNWATREAPQIIKEPQWRRVGRPEGGALMPCYNSRAQQEEDRGFFPRTQSMKSLRLFFKKTKQNKTLQSSRLPFSLYKRGLLPLLSWELHVACHADPKLQFSADVNQHIFAGEISSSLFVSGQQVL